MEEMTEEKMVIPPLETTGSNGTTQETENSQELLNSDDSQRNDKTLTIQRKSTSCKRVSTKEILQTVDTRQSSHSIKVYVRLKPYPREMKLTREQESAYQIIEQNALFFNLQRPDNSWDKNRTVDVVGKKFLFSQAFCPPINQGMVFEPVIKPQLTHFFGGKNCTVMAYGTSDSGKTYTLEGSFTNPGLIPRTLQHIFFLKNPKTSPSYKPIGNNVEVLNETESSLEIALRMKILSSLSENNPDEVNSCAKALKRLDEQLRLAPVEPTDVQHEVWVSYTEIRDETFYDLLSPEYNKVRYPLKLVTDDEDKPFVKGLSYLSVGSASEAWDALVTGQNNLKRFNTTWNTRSSKSHCIFSVVVLKYYELDEPERVQMSRFSFCDLAAQESPNIDSSLISLTKSLKIINNNQPQNTKTSEYFCQSKLTCLFHKALTGEESLSLVVNINPLLSMYKETISVLHSTALATEVLTKSKKINAGKMSTQVGKIIDGNIDDWDDLISNDLNEELLKFKGETAAIKALSLRTDIQAREAILNKYTTIIEKLSKMQRRIQKDNPQPEKKIRRRKSTDKKQKLAEIRESEDEWTTEDDDLKITVQKFRTQKQMMQRELTQVQLQLENLLSEVNVNNSIDLMNAKDLSLIICDKTIECKNKELKINSLIGLLNQAKNELTKMFNESREKDKKYCELEKKYLTMKLNRESDSIIQNNTDYGFKVKCEMLEIMEYKLDRERELRQLYQAKFEELSNLKDSIVSRIEIDKLSTVDKSTSIDSILSPIEIDGISRVDKSTSTDIGILPTNSKILIDKSTEICDNSLNPELSMNFDNSIVNEPIEPLNNSHPPTVSSESDKITKVDEILEDVKVLKSQIGDVTVLKSQIEDVKVLKSQIEELVKNSNKNNNDSSACTSCSNNDDTTDISTKIGGDKDSSITNGTFKRSNSLRRSTRKRRSTFKTSRSQSRKRAKSEQIIMDPEIINCDNCESIIVDGNRYHCSICRNDDFDLCPDCFKKIGHHHELETRSLDG